MLRPARAGLAFWLAACGGPGPSGDAGASGESGTTSGGTTSGSEDGTGTGEESGDGGAECSMYAQDCPAGEKCNWRVSGATIVHVCVPVTGDQAVGEPCTHEGVFSGADDCDIEGLCYGAVKITSGWPGICRRYCQGDEQAPLCEVADYMCTTGDLPACLPTCDPLLQDCPGAGQMCFYWYEWQAHGFVCAATGDTADVGDNCLVPFDCRKGLTCQPGPRVPGCTGENCCTEFCDLSAANTCAAAGMGAECVSLDIGGEYQDVGACLIPD